MQSPFEACSSANFQASGRLIYAAENQKSMPFKKQSNKKQSKEAPDSAGQLKKILDFYNQRLKNSKLGNIYDYEKFQSVILESLSKDNGVDVDLAMRQFLHKYAGQNRTPVLHADLAKYLGKPVLLHAQVVSIGALKTSKNNRKYRYNWFRDSSGSFGCLFCK